ncbi:hypothetical protein F66182_8023 [Fusarium sp. NRRL 66182]|nr:hypothetical protein F66182_8023 [Fusarium sp. NRRL 66182]
MADEHDNRPTKSPYASDVCAVYFEGGGPLYIPRQILHQCEAIASESADIDVVVSLSEIAVDAGHVLVHFLITSTYQCLDPQEETLERKHASELATALRVYNASELLRLPSLRDLARAEIVRLGDKLGLPAVIKVMEDSGLAFDALPAINAYIESRILSFAANASQDSADKMLLELGRPDTLSKVLLRSILIQKVSVREKKLGPTMQECVDTSLGVLNDTPLEAQLVMLELRPAEEAMKLAEQRALREAQWKKWVYEARELEGLRHKEATGRRLKIREKQRLKELEEKEAERARTQAARDACIKAETGTLPDEVDEQNDWQVLDPARTSIYGGKWNLI